MEEIRGFEEHRSSIKLGNGIYDIVVQRQAIIGQRTDAQNKLLDALTREAKLAAKIRYLETARAQIPATTSSVSTDQNDEAIHARDAMIDLRQQELALATRYGAANPELARVRSQIAGLQHKVEGTSIQRNKVTTAPSPVRQAVEQEVLMDRAELNTLAGEIERLRQVAEERDGELQRLERADLDLRSTVLRIDVLTDNLRAMQGRYEQARAQEQTELAHQVSVVQVAAALASEKPVKPKKLIFGLVGGLGALLAAGGIALFGILVEQDGGDRGCGGAAAGDAGAGGAADAQAAAAFLARRGMKLGWYLNRLRRMSAAEVAARVQVAARQKYWSVPQLRPEGTESLLPGPRVGRVALRRRAAAPSGAGAEAVVAAAERLLEGEWPVFDLRPAPVGAVPDWFRDPLTGLVSTPDVYAFDVPYRQEQQGRQHQVCLGAVAASGDDGAGFGLVDHRRRPLCGAGGGASAVVVGGQSVPERGALDERDRGRDPAAVVDVDAGAAGGLGGS